jgi:hypothetical protein
MRRALRGSVALGFVACMAVVFVVRDAHLGAPAEWTAGSVDLGLAAGDDYAAVVDKLGEPASDRWRDAASGGGYRRLGYPGRRLAVILAGESSEMARYAGTLGRNGRVVDAAVPAVMRELMPGWR